MYNQTILIVLGVVVVLFVIFVNAGLWARRYTRVGPNEAMVVYGRKIRRPDGTMSAGYRIVKGGGTLVLPLIEEAKVLSLEVRTFELPRFRVRAARGELLDLDCVAQVKVKGDDLSIVTAAEHFLSKTDAEMKSTLKPILEKHLALVLGGLCCEELNQRPEACAVKVQSAAAADLNQMGLDVINLGISNVRSA